MIAMGGAENDGTHFVGIILCLILVPLAVLAWFHLGIRP